MAVNIDTGSRKRGRGSGRSSNAHVHFSTSRQEMFKVVFLGDSNVGKTCLARMLADRRTLDQSTATIGFDYHTIDIQVDGGNHATLQIWDTAGMEKFRNAQALVPQYYSNTDGIVLVFDLSQRESFDGLENWISEMRQHSLRRSRTEKINMILVGNKLDLVEERKVTRKVAQGFADSHDMVAYIELSAKDIHYLELFEDTVSALTSHMIKCREESERKLINKATSQNSIFSRTRGRPSRHDIESEWSSAVSSRSTRSRGRPPRYDIEREWSSATSADPDTIRVGTPIMQDFASSGAFNNDWELLSAPEGNVPEYVYSAQEKKHSESQRCAC